MKLTEEEKLVRMEYAENIAQEIFRSLGKRLNKEKLGIADSLHVGVVLSSCIINVASKHSTFPKEEILNQFIEALEDQIDAHELVSLN